MDQIIDLTHTLHEGMTSFNSYWHPLIEINQIGRIDFEGRETRKITIGTHAGTHMDAPLHFVKDGLSIDQIPLHRLLGPVTILDFSDLGENGCITTEHLQNVEITEKMMFNLGWSQYWGQKKFYSGYPYFSVEAANFLVDNGLKLLCLDTPSPDDSRIRLEKETLGSEADSPIHKIFLNNDVFLVEYLANLDSLSELEGWTVSVMPLKLQGADGSPSRVCLFK